MEFRWEYAQPYFTKLDSPGYGSKKQWMQWYEKAWGYLSEARLVKVESPLDETLVRLRIFALCWLSHDYCAAVLADAWSSSPDWTEWIDCLGIDPLWALLITLDESVVRDLLKESALTSPDRIDEIEEEGIFVDKQGIDGDLVPRLVLTVVYSRRREVIDALLEGFGGDGGLFVSMHVNCYAIEDAVDERRDWLEDQLERLEEQLTRPSSDEATMQLQKRLEYMHQQLSEKALNEHALEGLLDRIAEPIFYGDEDSRERLNGCQWCNEGCPVVARGTPEFYIPKGD